MRESFESIETMALAGKLVSEVKINVAAEKYYKIWKHEVSHVPKICPKYIQKVEVHEGDWDSHGHGSVKIWHYSIGMYKYYHFCFYFHLLS